MVFPRRGNVGRLPRVFLEQLVQCCITTVTTSWRPCAHPTVGVGGGSEGGTRGAAAILDSVDGQFAPKVCSGGAIEGVEDMASYMVALGHDLLAMVVSGCNHEDTGASAQGMGEDSTLSWA